MKIFISWSGEKSKRVAEALKRFLPRVIQTIRPFLSLEIEKGARWSAEIAQQLESTDFGIICLTRSNIESPWIHFEAGALSRNIGAGRVVPLVLDLSLSDLNYPIAQFQSVSCTKEDVYLLISQINNGQETQLPADVLADSFENNWIILSNTLDGITSDIENDDVLTDVKDERDILEEILNITRSISRSFVTKGEIVGLFEEIVGQHIHVSNNIYRRVSDSARMISATSSEGARQAMRDALVKLRADIESGKVPLVPPAYLGDDSIEEKGNPKSEK
ncbi:MAG: toll/interleukin-1 receptor domain-containing protein [Bacteroidota bacterium]